MTLTSSATCYCRLISSSKEAALCRAAATPLALAKATPKARRALLVTSFVAMPAMGNDAKYYLVG